MGSKATDRSEIDNAEAIGERMRGLRERAGKKQSTVAAEVGCTQPQIVAYEKGKTKPPPRRWAALATSLGCSVAYLIKGQENVASANAIEGQPGGYQLSASAPLLASTAVAIGYEISRLTRSNIFFPTMAQGFVDLEILNIFKPIQSFATRALLSWIEDITAPLFILGRRSGFWKINGYYQSH